MPSEPRHPVPESELLAGLPPVREVSADEVAAAVAGGPRLVVLDDDPTGTQTVADVPVLTSWSVDDLRWALRQDSAAFFVLTNTRSLSPGDAAERNRQIVRALAEAAASEGVDYALCSRSDSTLRGHFPLETDVLAEELEALGSGGTVDGGQRSPARVDGIVLVPAFIEAGRLTVRSVHWMRTAEGMLPVGESEFARDATFGYGRSALPEWVEERTDGRVAAADVLRITLDDLRTGGPEHVTGLLRQLRDRRTAVVDAVCDDDLRVLALALAAAERGGTRLLYRVGPSFVRARSGQRARPPLTAEALGAPEGAHGIVVAGSHVGLTTRQLERLREHRGSALAEFELDVPVLLDPERRGTHLAETARACAEAMAERDVVLRTSRTVVTGADGADSLAIARTVSSALVETVRAVTDARKPAFVVAKGGITSSDVATEGLGIRRAWARGTLLPGIVSVWEPVDGSAPGVPYVVFAGNVGDEDALHEALKAFRPS